MVRVVDCSRCGTPVRRLGTRVLARPVVCEACVAPAADLVSAHLYATAHQALGRDLDRFDTSGSYRDAQLPVVPTTRWERLAIEQLTAHRELLTAGDAGRRGLMFFGPTGIGKTRAAIAICRQAGTYDPAGVLITSEAQLFDPRVPPWELAEHVAQRISGRSVVAIDDIGVVSRSPDQLMAGWKALCDNINASPLPLLVLGTTNRHSWEALRDWCGAQAVSRLEQFMVSATTGWTDHRTGRIHHQWHAAVGGQTAAAGQKPVSDTGGHFGATGRESA